MGVQRPGVGEDVVDTVAGAVSRVGGALPQEAAHAQGADLLRTQVEVPRQGVGTRQAGQRGPGAGELGGGHVRAGGQVGAADGETTGPGQDPRRQAHLRGEQDPGGRCLQAVGTRVQGRTELAPAHRPTAAREQGGSPSEPAHVPGGHGVTADQGVAETGQGASGGRERRAQDVVTAPRKAGAPGATAQPGDAAGVGGGEAVVGPPQGRGELGDLVEATRAGLPQVHLLEGDDVRPQGGQLLGQGDQDLAGRPGVPGVGTRACGCRGERTELGVLEVEGQQAQHVVPQAWPTSWAAGGLAGRGPGERRGASSGRAPASWKVRLTEFMQ